MVPCSGCPVSNAAFCTLVIGKYDNSSVCQQIPESGQSNSNGKHFQSCDLIITSLAELLHNFWCRQSVCVQYLFSCEQDGRAPTSTNKYLDIFNSDQSHMCLPWRHTPCVDMQVQRWIPRWLPWPYFGDPFSQDHEPPHQCLTQCSVKETL